MSMFGGIDAAASGLTAERLRMDVISNNIANVNSTRTVDGVPFKRRYVIFEPRESQSKNFARVLAGEMKGHGFNTGEGVRAVGIGVDNTQCRGGVCHGVGAMKNHESIVFLIVVRYDMDYVNPQFRRHVAAVNRRIELVGVDVC